MTIDEAFAYNRGFKQGYNKAIDDFVNACKEDILCQTFGLHINGIEKLAEQLKAGEENGMKRCKCSNCLTSYGCLDTPYCPNCGRKMTGFEKNEEISTEE